MNEMKRMRVSHAECHLYYTQGYACMQSKLYKVLSHAQAGTKVIDHAWSIVTVKRTLYIYIYKRN